VAFQSRVAEEDADQPFDIDDVAGGLVAKLVRRHPHVFADTAATTPEEVERNWEQIKAQERAEKAARGKDAAGTGDGSGSPAPASDHAGGEAGHAGLLHGIPASLPALLAADKVVARLERRGDALPPPGDDVASQLLALVARARAEGTDAEAELRRALRALSAQD
jgi:XTP/dITP diphosphohydrolase